MPRYWSQNNPPYEVDFLIQRRTTSSQWRSNPKLDDDVLNIPLFMADQADRFIGLALEPGNAQ